ncbi:hypothetical protein, partial [Pedobacter caeni]|uniref:hypothetical protein n=1 Tax=Pedobacter caeni TaxID=288992 RepID=UPI001F31E03A
MQRKGSALTLLLFVKGNQGQTNFWYCSKTSTPKQKADKQEKPAVSYRLSFKIWHRPTLPRVTAVPSALVGLTSL